MNTKYPSFRFVFDRKHVATKQHRGLVQLEVYYQGKRKWIGTGVKLFRDQWDDRRKTVRSSDMLELNDRLDAIMNSAVAFSNDLIRNGENFDFAKLERHLERDSGKEQNYIDYVARMIDERPCIRESTRKQLSTLITALLEFGKIVSMADLTTENIVAFDKFLRNKGLSQPTIGNYHKRNKIFVNQALNSGLLTSDPYAGFKVDRGHSHKRRYLTKEEMAAIANCAVPTKAIERARDLFLFQCLTGLAYADLAKFNFATDVERRGERYAIRDRRVKTDEDYFVIIIRPAMDILNKYNFRLPVISNQKYNASLKMLSAYAGLPMPLTTHMARHTFAVNALNAGVQIEVVSRMLGHTNIRTTQEYAKIVGETVEKGFDIIEKAVLSQ